MNLPCNGSSELLRKGATPATSVKEEEKRSTFAVAGEMGACYPNKACAVWLQRARWVFKPPEEDAEVMLVRVFLEEPPRVSNQNPLQIQQLFEALLP